MRTLRYSLVLIPLLAALCAPPPVHAGADDGPYPVLDICPGSTGSIIDGPALFSNGRQVFFKANDGVHGYQLWGSDGTPQGTKMLTSTANPDATGFSPFVADCAGRVYFVHSDQDHGAELWVSDGTAAGTKMLRDWRPGSASGINPRGQLLLHGSHVYFIGGSDGTNWGLCRTDGTAAGMQLVKALSVPTSYGSLYCFGPFLGRVFIHHQHASSDPLSQVLDLWCSDGTAAGTQFLATLGAWTSLNPAMAALGGNLYLQVETEPGDAIWKTDGTPAGTKQVHKQFAQELGGLTVFRDRLHFFGASQFSSPAALYSFDAATSSATKIADLIDSGLSALPLYACPEGDQLFFANSYGLWLSDGTASGTARIKSMRVGECYKLAGLRRWLFSGAINSGSRLELWRTDGTAGGTRRIPWPGGASSIYTGDPGGFVQCGDWAVFTVFDWRGRELWRLPLNSFYNPVRAWGAFR